MPTNPLQSSARQQQRQINKKIRVCMDGRTDRRVCVRVELKKLTEILLVFAQAQAKVNLKYLTTSVDQKSPTLQGRGRGKR